MGFFTKFFGRTASEGAAFALGVAVGPALSPAVRELVNAAWNRYPTMPLQAIELAQGVASGQVNRTWATNEAQNTGVDTERFNALVRVFDAGPGIERAYQLWHRGILDEAGFRRAVKREALEPEWIDALVAARQTLLTPAELANARQQGYIQEPRQKAEAEKWGIDDERAELQFLLSGLPPGVETGLEMLRRSIINEDEFAQLVREGHTKTKYTDELLAMRHPVLSASQAATLRLKGWISAQTSYDLGALTGYTPAQMDRLYEASGRPMAPGQMWTALARKTVGPGGGAFSKQDFLDGIRRSDIRPEYGEALYAIRHAYPPLFQINRLVQAGAIDTATAVDWAEKDRYAPEVVSALREYWQQGATGGVDSHVSKAQTQLWTTLHRSFIAGETNATQARSTMGMLGIPTAERGTIINLWTAERELIRKQLTPAQVKKAYAKSVRNPATGATWTRDDALAALLERGYAINDANTFLDE